jgi:hypothetical protein
MLINDNRACARAVNDILCPKPPDPAKKHSPRQAMPAFKAYFFGHYDSRGGAFMIVAPNHIAALKRYAAETFFCDVDAAPEEADPGQTDFVKQHMGLEGEDLREEMSGWRDGLVDGCQEDFLFRAEVIVCDAPLPAEAADVDEGYVGKGGWKYGRVQCRYAELDYSKPGHPPTGKFSKWRDFGPVVLWRGRAPEVSFSQSILKEEFRVKRLSLGEDACGLVYMP